MSIHDTPLQVRRSRAGYESGVIDSDGEQCVFCAEHTAEVIVEAMNAQALLTEPDIRNRPAWIHWCKGNHNITLEAAIEYRRKILKVRKVKK